MTLRLTRESTRAEKETNPMNPINEKGERCTNDGHPKRKKKNAPKKDIHKGKKHVPLSEQRPQRWSTSELCVIVTDY